MEHCRHCTDPDDPRHADPEYAKAEAQCAFYEHPENREPAGPGHKHPKDTRWGPYVLQRLRELENGEGREFWEAEWPPAGAILNARRVCSQTFRPDTPTPSVVPTAEGEVAFIWMKNSHDAEITVTADDATLWLRDRVTGEEWSGSLAEHAGQLLDAVADGA